MGARLSWLHLPQESPRMGSAPRRGQGFKPLKLRGKGSSQSFSWNAGWLHAGKARILEKCLPNHAVSAGPPRPTPASGTHGKQMPNRRGGSTCLWEQHVLLRRIRISMLRPQNRLTLKDKVPEFLGMVSGHCTASLHGQLH